VQGHVEVFIVVYPEGLSQSGSYHHDTVISCSGTRRSYMYMHVGAEALPLLLR
jgi:hypothetical protein